MKISFQRLNSARRSKPLFVMVSKFETDNFPVSVRRLRLAQSMGANVSPDASKLDRRGIPQRQRQDKIIPDGVVLDRLIQRPNFKAFMTGEKTEHNNHA
jgi:hypothetical protein